MYTWPFRGSETLQASVRALSSLSRDKQRGSTGTAYQHIFVRCDDRVDHQVFHGQFPLEHGAWLRQPLSYIIGLARMFCGSKRNLQMESVFLNALG